MFNPDVDGTAVPETPPRHVIDLVSTTSVAAMDCDFIDCDVVYATPDMDVEGGDNGPLILHNYTAPTAAHPPLPTRQSDADSAILTLNAPVPATSPLRPSPEPPLSSPCTASEPATRPPVQHTMSPPHDLVYNGRGRAALAWLQIAGSVTPMPPRWCNAVQRVIQDMKECRFRSKSDLPVSLVRMYVSPDGSCSAGALVRALLDAVPAILPPTVAGASDPIAALRSHIAGRVASWSDSEWEKVPVVLRMQAAEHSLPESLQGQRDAFVQICSDRNRVISPAFFYFASVVLRVGVILLVLPRTGTGHVLDFCTKEQSRSVIVVSLHGPNAGSDVTHYETVGLRLMSEHGNSAKYRTTFPNDDALLQAIRTYALRSDDARTLDHERLAYGYYHPPEAAATAAPAACSGVSLSLSSDLSSTQDDLAPRAIRLPQRYAQPPTTAPATPAPASARGSRRTRRGTAHSPTQSSNGPGQRKAATRHSPSCAESGGSASQRAPQSSPAATWSRPPVAIRPPGDLSSGQQTITADVMRNVRQWVRKMAGRHRLAARVHFSCIPLWTLRCRTALHSLAAALRADPIDERAIIARLCALWLLPGEVFSTPSRTGGGKARRKARHNRILHNLQDRDLFDRLCAQASAAAAGCVASGDESQQQAWSTLSAMLQQSPASAAPSESDSGDDGDVDSDDNSRTTNTPPRTAHGASDASAAQRVQRLFALGHARKAMETLTAVTSLADLDDDGERSLLRRLHPATDCPLPVCPAEAPAPEVDPVWLADAMRASDHGGSHWAVWLGLQPAVCAGRRRALRCAHGVFRFADYQQPPASDCPHSADHLLPGLHQERHDRRWPPPRRNRRHVLPTGWPLRCLTGPARCANGGGATPVWRWPVGWLHTGGTLRPAPVDDFICAASSCCGRSGRCQCWFRTANGLSQH